MVTDQNKIRTKHLRGSTGNSSRMGSDSDTLLVIKLPDPKVIRLVSRSVFLALVLVTFPSIGSFVKGLNNPAKTDAVSFDFEQSDMLLCSLFEEGLLREGHNGLIIGARDYIFKNLPANQTVIMAMDPASDEGPSFLDETFDFVYTSDLARDRAFADRILKTGGIIAFPLDEEERAITLVSHVYMIVYIRRFSSTMVAMRKMEANRGITERATARRLLQIPLSLAEQGKTGTLYEPEEVLLEPPGLQRHQQRRQWKTKFLPQLLGEGSLSGFGRRFFVNVVRVGQRRDAAGWFDRNYPKMRQEFEVYDLSVVHEEGGATVSDWVRENLREEEYVVMKAEAEVVEEMVSSKTIQLVDELFLECKNEWWKVGSKRRRRRRSYRAYWECLALYGRVKDEGVAVHQWWG